MLKRAGRVNEDPAFPQEINFRHVPCGTSLFDYNNTVGVQKKILNRFHERVPSRPISEDFDTPISFTVPFNPVRFIDLSSVYLEMEMKLLRQDGTALQLADKVTPINGVGLTFIKNVDITLNGKRISTPQHNYAYLIQLLDLVFMSTESKNNFLTSQLVYPDTSFDSVDPAVTTNENLVTRNEYFTLSKTCNLRSRLHLDIGSGGRAIFPMEIGIDLYRNKNSFVLLAPQNQYKYVISNAVLWVPTIALIDTERLAKEKQLSSTGINIKFVGHEITSYTINQNVTNFSCELVRGHLPFRCFLFFSPQSTCNGDFTKNPFQMDNLNLKFLQFSVNNRPVPSTAYTPDFPSGQYMRLYSALFQSIGFEGRSFCDRQLFGNGQTLIGANLSADNDDNLCEWVSKPEVGSLTIRTTFGTPVPESYTLILISQYYKILHMSKYKDCNILDFEVS